MARLNIRKIEALTGHQGAIYRLIDNEKESGRFYSAGGDGNVIQWDLENPEVANVVAKVPTHIFSLCQIPSAEILLLGQMEGGIHVIDIAKKLEMKHLALHKKPVFDISIHPESSRILAAGGDGILSEWNPTDFSLTNAREISSSAIRSLCFHPKSNVIALGCSDNNIYLLHPKTYEVIQVLEKHTNSVFSVTFSPDGKYLLSGSRDAQLCIWNVEKKYDIYRVVPAHLFTINCIVFHPDGKLFATASRDKTIKIWDAGNFDLLKVIDKVKLDGHLNSVNALLWKSKQLISCSDDRAILIWETT